VSRPPCAPLRRRRLSRATRRRGQSASRVRRLSRRHRPRSKSTIAVMAAGIIAADTLTGLDTITAARLTAMAMGMGIPMLIPLCRRRCPCLFLDGEWTAASFRRPAAVFAWRQSPSKKVRRIMARLFSRGRADWRRRVTLGCCSALEQVSRKALDLRAGLEPVRSLVAYFTTPIACAARSDLTCRAAVPPLCCRPTSALTRGSQ